MRQVNHDELVNVIQAALRRITRSQLNAINHWRPEEQLRGRLMIAQQVAEAMKRWEILSSAPEGPPVTYAAMGDRSGAPPVND